MFAGEEQWAITLQGMSFCDLRRKCSSKQKRLDVMILFQFFAILRKFFAYSYIFLIFYKKLSFFFFEVFTTKMTTAEIVYR